MSTLTRREPAGADEDHIQASYDRGILEITIGFTAKEAPEAARRIPVRPVQHIKAT